MTTRTVRQNRQATPPLTKQVRCAVYTRKSTDEGLDQEFNSLDAQREAAEAFIASHATKSLPAGEIEKFVVCHGQLRAGVKVTRALGTGESHPPAGGTSRMKTMWFRGILRSDLDRCGCGDSSRL